MATGDQRLGRATELLKLTSARLGNPRPQRPATLREAELFATRLLGASPSNKDAIGAAAMTLLEVGDPLATHLQRHCRPRSPRCAECPILSLCSNGEERTSAGSASGSSPYAVDLFAGAGGLSLGMRRAGLRVHAAVESDANAAQTYRANHPGTLLLEQDVTAVSAADLTDGEGNPPLALVAGPPCQGYSAAGARDPLEPRNRLFGEVARLAQELQPRFVVIENVPGLRRVNGVGFSSLIADALREVGYSVGPPHLLRAEDFGVPQRRRRLVYFAQHQRFRADLLPPWPTHDVDGAGDLPRPPTVEQTLADLPAFGPGRVCENEMVDGALLLNASTMAHSDRVIAKIGRIEPGKGPMSYRRLERSLARTLTAGHRALPVHPWLDRTISVREAARLQGFPDCYVFAGSRSNQPLQVANAVPIPMAEAIGRRLLEVATTY